MRNIYIVIIGCLILTSGAAFSQEKGFNSDLDIGFTLSPSTEDISALSISPKIELVYGFQNSWNIGAQIGLSWVILNRINYGTVSSFDQGNLIISTGKGNIRLTSNITGSIRIKAGIPLATFPGNIPDNRITEYNYNNANSSFGWKDPFTWLMNAVPLTTEFDFTSKINNQYSLQIKTEPAFLFSVNSRSSQFCFSGTLGLNADIGITELNIGGAAYYSSLSIENNYHTQNSVFIGTRMDLFGKENQIYFNLNLDRPNGIAEKTAKPNWGINLRSSF